MKTAYEEKRDEQLARKLSLYLGSKNDWLHPYAEWCEENDVLPGEVYEDRTILLFVEHARQAT